MKPRQLSPCDVDALKKCLDESKGDYKRVQAEGFLRMIPSTSLHRDTRAFCIPTTQCEAEVLAFQHSCSKPKVIDSEGV